MCVCGGGDKRLGRGAYSYIALIKKTVGIGQTTSHNTIIYKIARVIFALIKCFLSKKSDEIGLN